tara:strand:- start:398 stop:1261 length:864 start_codon:yes stop_codon:yes gene_type:complete
MNQINRSEEEIDLIDLFKKLWKHKYKIFSSVTLSIIGTFIFLLINPTKSIVSTPFTYITEEEKLKYALLNRSLINRNLYPIDLGFLKNYYKELIEETAIEVLDEYDIISKSSYTSNEEFEFAFKKIFFVKGPFAAKNELKDYSLINLTIQNEEIWEEVINEIDERTNEKVRVEINNYIKNIISKLEAQYIEADKNIKLFAKEENINTNYLILNNYLALKEINDLFVLKDTFRESPIVNEDEFRATQLVLGSTEFEDPRNIIYFLTFFISFSSSSIYILRFLENNNKK